MFSLRTGQQLFSLVSLSASVLRCSLVLVLLTDSGSGQSQTVTAVAGADVVLPCHLEPAADVVAESLEWGRMDLNPRFVHVWHEGQNHLINQNPSYRGRTSLSMEKLQHGDLSLTLTDLRHADNGQYRCYVPSMSRTSTVELLVGSVSSPVIASVAVNSDIVVLECGSGGWFPEPELLWLDAEGNLLPAGPTETVRGADGLYTVSSRVTVDKRHSSNITCRVQQTKTNQTRDAHIHVTAEFLSPTSCSPACLSIVSVVSLVFISASAFSVWKWRQNVINETKLLQTDQREKKAKLDDELQKKEEELEHLEQLEDVLTEQRNELLNLIEQVLAQHKDMDREHRETEEKVESVEKESDNDRYYELKGIILESLQQMEKRKNQLQQLETKARSLANKTDAEIDKIRQRKKEVEKHKEETRLKMKREAERGEIPTAHLLEESQDVGGA